MLDVYVYGSGECDQLGIGESDEFEAKIPKQVLNLNSSIESKVYKIACGGMHTLVLTTMGRIHSWGCNDDKALGRSGPDNEPVLVSSLTTPMNAISAGDSHSVAYSTDLNQLYLWGAYRNSSGKLGESIETPKLIEKFSKEKIKKVVSGNNHTLVLCTSGLYAWGDSEFGQTGRKVERGDFDPYLPSKFSTKNVVDVFTASHHSFLLTLKNKKKILKSWGLNNYGQLGTGDKENAWIPKDIPYFNDNNINIVYVNGGDYHSVALDDNGNVYSWGRNDDSQCGIKQIVIKGAQKVNNMGLLGCCSHGETEKLPAQPTETNHEAHVNGDAIENDSPAEEDKDVFVIPQLMEFFQNERKVTSLSSSMHFNYALTNEGVYSWGLGESYVLGNKKEKNEEIPFRVPEEFYKNLKVHQISLGAQHVAVSLYDPTVTTELPTLEYDISAFKPEVKKRGGKRKAEESIAKDESEEERKPEPKKKKTEEGAKPVRRVTVERKVEVIVHKKKKEDKAEKKKEEPARGRKTTRATRTSTKSEGAKKEATTSKRSKSTKSTAKVSKAKLKPKSAAKSKSKPPKAKKTVKATAKAKPSKSRTKKQ